MRALRKGERPTRALCAALKYDEAERLAQGADVAALRRYVDEVRAGVAEEARAEAAAREAEDDHAAAALATYVAKLQASLALVNNEDSAF